MERTGQGGIGALRLVLVDDEPLMRTGLRTILERAQDIKVVDACHGGGAAAAVTRHRPRRRPKCWPWRRSLSTNRTATSSSSVTDRHFRNRLYS